MGVSDVDEETEVRRLTVEEIALLREVSRWRRGHGVNFFQWRPGKGFGVMTEWKCWVDDETAWTGRGLRGRRQINVTYEPDRSGAHEPGPRVVVTKNYYGGENFLALPTITVTETVDCLVALGYLPPRFSLAYRAGWHAAQVWNDPDQIPGEFRRLFHDPENTSFPVGED